MKACTHCGLVKSPAEFHRSSAAKDGRASWCKPCANSIGRASRKRCYSEDQKRRWAIKSRYGLTSDQLAEMLLIQGGLCGICKTPPARVCIDHDHGTGEVRGILCHRCNIGLAYVEDADYRASAIAWLGRGAGSPPAATA